MPPEHGAQGGSQEAEARLSNIPFPSFHTDSDAKQKQFPCTWYQIAHAAGPSDPLRAPRIRLGPLGRPSRNGKSGLDLHPWERMHTVNFGFQELGDAFQMPHLLDVLGRLKSVTTLVLIESELYDLHHVDLPPTLEHLFLSRNYFKKVAKLPRQSSKALRDLHLGSNYLSDLKGLEKHFPCIESLSLVSNPVEEDAGYLDKLKALQAKIPTLKYVDSKPI